MDPVLKNRPTSVAAVPRALRGEAFGEAAAAGQSSSLRGMNARQMHQHILKQYTHFYGDDAQQSSQPPQQRSIRSDYDAVRQEHRFLWEEAPRETAPLVSQEQWGGAPDIRMTWEQRLAKKYYERLHKEYAIADMSRYREGVGLRWRVEAEVFDGKGQFLCGSKTCANDGDLCSYEVNFGYVERGENKQALVKLRVCPGCARKLSYRQRKEGKRAKKEKREHTKSKKRMKHDQRKSKKGKDGKKERRQRDMSSSSSDTEEGEEEEDGVEGRQAVEDGQLCRDGVAAGGSRKRTREDNGPAHSGGHAKPANPPLDFDACQEANAPALSTQRKASSQLQGAGGAAAVDNDHFHDYYGRVVAELLL